MWFSLVIQDKSMPLWSIEYCPRIHEETKHTQKSRNHNFHSRGIRASFPFLKDCSLPLITPSSYPNMPLLAGVGWGGGNLAKDQGYCFILEFNPYQLAQWHSQPGSSGRDRRIRAVGFDAHSRGWVSQAHPCLLRPSALRDTCSALETPSRPVPPSAFTI